MLWKNYDAQKTSAILLLLKPDFVKNLFILISLLTIVWGCQNSLAKKNVTTVVTPIIKSQSGPLYAKVSAYMKDKLLTRGFNGSILIARNDTVFYEKYFGKTDLKKKDSITENTALHIASSGKMLTAVAVLQLIQDKKISLEDSLGKFFSGFPYKGITVRMLLSHHSGLPKYLYFISDSIWNKTERVTNQDVLDLLYSKQPDAYFTPGTRYGYCNTNFVLLALIIEKISGEKYPEYMKKHFFQPLHMDHTYVFTHEDSATATPSFNYNNHLWQNDFFDLTYGDKNIYTTPNDLFRWSQALFSGKLINASLMDSAFTPQNFGSHQNSKLFYPGRNYGLGFHLLFTPHGKKVIYHFGRWHGFNAAFARLPDEKVTIIILGNRFTKMIYYAARMSYDLFGDYFAAPDHEEDEMDDQDQQKQTKITSNHKGKIVHKKAVPKKQRR